MTAAFQRHPLVMAVFAMVVAALAFPFQMYGLQYAVLFGAIVLVWGGLVVASFRNRTWKGALALGLPVVLVVPYFFIMFWFCCVTGLFGGCI